MQIKFSDMMANGEHRDVPQKRFLIVKGEIEELVEIGNMEDAIAEYRLHMHFERADGTPHIRRFRAHSREKLSDRVLRFAKDFMTEEMVKFSVL